MSALRLTNYRDKINIPKKSFKNKVKINMDEDHEGKILLEISFIKDNNIYNRHLKIYKAKLVPILEKFKNNNFLILGDDHNQISNLNNTVVKNVHPEYSNNNINNFLRNSYSNSFNQKYK